MKNSVDPTIPERAVRRHLAEESKVSQYKKRAKELKHDAFRDRTLEAFEGLGNALEGKGRLILYGLAALVALGILAGVLTLRSQRKEQEARQALGRAIDISEGYVGTSPPPNSAFTFTTKEERARRAAEEFNRVAEKYGEPYRSKSKYFAAVNLLTVDRNRGLSELEALKNSGSDEVSAWAKFALAQAREAGGEYDAAAVLYNELAQQNNSVIPADLARQRLAAVYEKTGKKKEAVDLLFRIVEAARTAKDKDGKPVLQSSTAREAEERLQTLDPARFEQLPPAPAPSLGGLNL